MLVEKGQAALSVLAGTPCYEQEQPTFLRTSDIRMHLTGETPQKANSHSPNPIGDDNQYEFGIIGGASWRRYRIFNRRHWRTSWPSGFIGRRI
ncbi:hypothetical protein [Cohnella sp.]|uniref:hypothetical protein n=1 Tax=Cohnella sp. TaxID=1883426 RepID=UPI003565F164